jgi:fructoselysine 6-kinase
MPARQPKLVALGDNCLDVYLTRKVLTVGGNALNVAAHWRASGWAARYFGVVGDDEGGAIVRAGVEAAGLSPEDVEVLPGETAVTLISDRSGDREFLHESFGAGENFMPSARQFVEIGTADWVHLGTNANPDLVRRLLVERRPFSLDVSTAHRALPLSGVPLVFASGRDDPAIPVEPVIAALRKAGAHQVALTCGSRGAFFEDGGGISHAAAAPVEVIDTCGAGDSFIAAFVTALCCERLGGPAALERAAAAAAVTCTHVGGFPQEPRPIPVWLTGRFRQHFVRDRGP